MLIKAGVSIHRLKRPCRRQLPFLEKLYKSIGQELIVTSTYEGTHDAGSLHYSDEAFDVRLPNITDLKGFVGTIKQWTKPDFDVVLRTDHIHIEYDPKG